MNKLAQLHIIFLFVLALLLGTSLLKDFGVDQKLSGAVVGANTETGVTVPEGKLYKVLEVVDGDTIGVAIDGEVRKVRFIGMDTPETRKPNTPVQCFGKEASAYTTKLLASKNVVLKNDPTQAKEDRYGRMLAYVYTEDGIFVNKKLVEDGYAFEYTYNVPYQFQKEFKTAERLARENGKGLWAADTCKGVR